tara:strand:- start:2608 stop:3360 length:753 start_codon:yes stop_codon:yes gene_type:complete
MAMEQNAQIKPVDIDGEVMETLNLPKEFEHEIQGRPDFARLSVQLKANEKIKAEASAMVSMDTNISMKTKFKGGFKRFMGGESLFINEFTAEQFPGEITFASGLPGDIYHYHLDADKEDALFLQSGAFLAGGMGVDVATKFQGLVKGFFAGAGLFMIKCTGHGDVFFNSYGGIVEIEVEDEYTIDNNHIVAFTEGLEYKVTKFSGYKSLFFSGEGFVTKFSGKGKVWIQTRKLPAFAKWIWPFRPSKNNN